MLSNTLELTLRKALHIASSYKHEYATCEHLLLALMEDKDARSVLIEKNINLKIINKQLISYLKKKVVDLVNENTKESKPTAEFQGIVQRAAIHSKSNGQKSINGTDVLAEFFFESDSYALACLKQVNLKRSDVLNYGNGTSTPSAIIDQDSLKEKEQVLHRDAQGNSAAIRRKSEINPEGNGSTEDCAKQTRSRA